MVTDHEKSEGMKIRTSVCSGLTTQKPEMEPAIQVLELVPSHPRRVTVNSRLSRVLHSHRCVVAALIPAGTRGVGAELLNNAASEQPNTCCQDSAQPHCRIRVNVLQM